METAPQSPSCLEISEGSFGTYHPAGLSITDSKFPSLVQDREGREKNIAPRYPRQGGPSHPRVILPRRLQEIAIHKSTCSQLKGRNPQVWKRHQEHLLEGEKGAHREVLGES